MCALAPSASSISPDLTTRTGRIGIPTSSHVMSCRNHLCLCNTFPMLVLSLSWHNDHYSVKWHRKQAALCALCRQPVDGRSACRRALRAPPGRSSAARSGALRSLSCSHPRPADRTTTQSRAEQSRAEQSRRAIFSTKARDCLPRAQDRSCKAKLLVGNDIRQQYVWLTQEVRPPSSNKE